MITLFNISGAMIYLDAEGNTIGYEDIFTKLEMCRGTTRPPGCRAITSTSSSGDGAGRNFACQSPL
jgi:hypothetical protein